MSAADLLVFGRVCVNNRDPPHEDSSVYFSFNVNVLYLHIHAHTLTLITWPEVCEILPRPLMGSSVVVGADETN